MRSGDIETQDASLTKTIGQQDLLWAHIEPHRIDFAT